VEEKFVNLSDYQKASKKNVTKMAYDYIRGGSIDELTLSRNTKAFRKILLKQNILVDVSSIDLRASVLGQELAKPLIIGAVSLHKLSHPDGEYATARAAENLNALMLLSSLSSTSLEDVATASSSPKWFQLYWNKDRTITRDIVERAEQAGYKAIALTVDAPVLGHREKDAYNQFTLPEDVFLENYRGMDQMKLPGVSGSNSGLAQYVADQIEDSITWKDLDWLQSLTNLPIIIKGLQTAEDAKRCVDYGVNGIIVSNHGGRQLDGSLSSIECLPRVVRAADGIDVMLDSGIRRGSDIVKAMALGAKAVLIGRPYIWGLGAKGQQGVEEVYNLLIKELEITMAMIGCPSLDQLDISFIEEHTIPNYP
jgi:4-hydroxymandelate oxidase